MPLPSLWYAKESSYHVLCCPFPSCSRFPSPPLLLSSLRLPPLPSFPCSFWFHTEQVDIKATLDRLQILQYNQGQHYINANPKIIDYHLQKCGGEGIPVDPSKIHWTPHLTNDRWLR